MSAPREWIGRQHPAAQVGLMALVGLVLVLGFTGKGLVWLIATRPGREVAGGLLGLAFLIDLAYSLTTQWS